MKNLSPISELKERIRRQSERTAWLRTDVESYLTAEAVQEGLGAWPGKLARTDVEFDPDEERTYGDVPGGKLSALAARIVLTANDEWRFLKVLRGVAEAMIAPLVAYLRVNLAMTRLEEVMNKSCHSGPLFASKQKAGMTDKRKKKKKKPPAFKWSQSPRAAYGFAEARAAYGFDPRDTSVYWIEKRAARLRRKWARHGRGDLSLEPSFESPGYARPQDEERGGLPGAEGASCEFPDEPETLDIPIKHFVPADADYNTIWPPMELPDGPPKLPGSTDQSTGNEPGTHSETPAVMREASPVDATLLGGDESSPVPYPHDGEQRSCPSKHGKAIQSSGLGPSFESRDVVPPQDEDFGVFLEGDDLTASSYPYDGERGTRPLKHGKENMPLEPSFESPACARPRDEERGQLLQTGVGGFAGFETHVDRACGAFGDDDGRGFPDDLPKGGFQGLLPRGPP